MVPFADLLAALDRIPDPRRRQGRRYPLAHLLLFSVLAVLAGATSCRGILVSIAVHRERLNAVFGAALRRAPAVDTLRALFLALDPAELEAAFRRHAGGLSGGVPAGGLRVIALDGKTLKRSFDHLNDRAAAQVLSAFASEAALILAHQEIAEGDEIAAAQALLGALGVRGVLFTADALHGRKKPSRARRTPAPLSWSGSRPTGRACTTPSRACAPSRTPSTGTRRSAAVGTAVRSTGASRSSRSPVGSRRSGGPGGAGPEGAGGRGVLRGRGPAPAGGGGGGRRPPRDPPPCLVQGPPRGLVAAPPRGRLLRQPGRTDGGGVRARGPGPLGDREPVAPRARPHPGRGRQPDPVPARRLRPPALVRAQHPARPRRH